ncbi:hypothetical protein B0H15DRAFT_484663 [Mycena belliarum]|uniref:Uncharacterized protein n=1 Tax=Mycena belliarum TaxID=1033014 RepID=A0AAD6TY04_9AGAR|nr:hypothetical protein B0H15DRAFT_484663 [Mycena belliae]
MRRTGMDRLGSGTRCPRHLVAPASLDRRLPCPLKTTTTTTSTTFHHHHHRLHPRKGHNAMCGRPWTLGRLARRGMWPIRLRPTLACGWTHFNAGSVRCLSSFRTELFWVFLVISWFLVVVVRRLVVFSQRRLRSHHADKHPTPYTPSFKDACCTPTMYSSVHPPLRTVKSESLAHRQGSRLSTSFCDTYLRSIICVVLLVAIVSYLVGILL